MRRILAGEQASASDLAKLTEAHQLDLWMWADPCVDIVSLQLRGASAEDIDRVLYPYRRLLSNRWNHYLAHMGYTSRMAQKEAGARARCAAEAWPEQASPWSETLSEDDELRLWNEVDREAMDAWRAGRMKGMPEPDILQRVYPNRRLLIETGRPDPQEQLRYARRMQTRASMPRFGDHLPSATVTAGATDVPTPEQVTGVGAAADAPVQELPDATAASDADASGFPRAADDVVSSTRRRGRRPRVITGLTPEA